MARAKPKWRRVLNARFLRWWLLVRAVRTFPALGRWLVFFPDPIGLIDGADQVLADEEHCISVASLADDLDFLKLAANHDSMDPEVAFPEGLRTGRRTAIYRSAIIDVDSGAVMLPETGQTVMARGQIVNWNATQPRPFRRRLALAGRVCAPLFTRNYFHVLTENGLRLLDLIDSGLVADRPLTLAVRPGAGRVSDAMYRGIADLTGAIDLCDVPEGALLEPDEAVLHFPRNTQWEWPPITAFAARRLGEAFDCVYDKAASAEGSARLYLSRRGAKMREPLNAADLEGALAREGFEHFVATDANHPEQIARFRAAKEIVAVHGAGLTNLLFCQPGTRVIEIFPENFVKSPYWNIARQLGLIYRPVIAGPGDYDQRFLVDPKPVLDAVKALRSD